MKKRTKRFADGGLQDDTPPSDPSGGLPPLRQVTPSLSDDQIAGKMKESKLRQTYGPTQNERDRRERAELAAEAKGEPPVYRSVDGKSGGMGPVKKLSKGGSASSRGDGCAQRGKTRGRMV
jgi:hypothetical protein